MTEPARAVTIPAVAERARAYFRTDVTRPYAFRLERLRALQAAIRANEQKLIDAVKADMGRGMHEGFSVEAGLPLGELKDAIKHLKSWMKPKRVSPSLALFPARAYHWPEPLGTALIIAPWNYPFQLLSAPLASAIAAGCNAVLKPSELAPNMEQVAVEVMKQAFGDDGFVTVVTGDVETSRQLLEEKWDIICFTGSTAVGKVVMQAAAKHLTPVLLELGGKSPVLVDERVDLATTARRLAWGKYYNCGQTCVAPDYVLAHKNIKAALVEQLGTAIREFYGADPSQSPDYGRVINARHFKRLQALMTGGRVALGGQTDEAKRYIAPTVLTDVDVKSPLMQEEIFGPLLPVLEVADLDEAVRFVRERPKPLALYVFTSDSAKAELVLSKTSSGGAMHNDTMLHAVPATLPFGGVGDSGIGAYHGKIGFDAFSHNKAVVKKPFWMDLKVRYPPYKVSLAAFKRLLGVS